MLRFLMASVQHVPCQAVTSSSVTQLEAEKKNFLSSTFITPALDRFHRLFRGG